jgi:signal transduction histidine kinase/FixJ family two-component response regulator
VNPTLTQPLSTPVDETATAPIRVLVVDDDENDFFVVSRLLTRNTFAEYQLEWAPSYIAGLEALERGGHDVAIVDYRLGMETGLELVRMAQAKNVDLPVILLTGHDSLEIDRESTRAGAADYLCKNGLTTGQLERSIRYALRHGNTLSELRKSQSQLELFMHNVPCAVAICDSSGKVLFQNRLFEEHIRDFDGDLRPRESATPWILRHQERCWLVTTFPMTVSLDRQLQGLAAIDITERVRSEEERLQQAQLLDNIMKNLPVIVGRLDAEGKVVEARGKLEHCRIDAETITDTIFADIFPQSRDALDRAARNEEVSFNLRGQANDREWHADFYAVGSPGGGVTFLGRDITERRWLEQRLLTVIDAEQQRIGADLHDGLGQKLTGLACLATALRDRLVKGDSENAEQANLIAALSNDATLESRALARGLCPVQLEQAGGLLSALQELTDSTEVIQGVRCRFRGPAQFDCDHLTGVQLYRISQEAINNALKHGEAKSIEVSLTATDHEDHRLTIADDGKGFDADARPLRKGGLRLMEYRANMIGGTFVLDSQPGLGTRVTCEFSTGHNRDRA